MVKHQLFKGALFIFFSVLVASTSGGCTADTGEEDDGDDEAGDEAAIAQVDSAFTTATPRMVCNFKNTEFKAAFRLVRSGGKLKLAGLLRGAESSRAKSNITSRKQRQFENGSFPVNRWAIVKNDVGFDASGRLSIWIQWDRDNRDDPSTECEFVYDTRRNSADRVRQCFDLCG